LFGHHVVSQLKEIISKHSAKKHDIARTLDDETNRVKFHSEEGEAENALVRHAKVCWNGHPELKISEPVMEGNV